MSSNILVCGLRVSCGGTGFCGSSFLRPVSLSISAILSGGGPKPPGPYILVWLQACSLNFWPLTSGTTRAIAWAASGPIRIPSVGSYRGIAKRGLNGSLGFSCALNSASSASRSPILLTNSSLLTLIGFLLCFPLVVLAHSCLHHHSTRTQ